MFRKTNRVLKLRFVVFPRVLEGFGSSGRLVGTISTYPGTYKCAWSRVTAKIPPKGIFIEYGISSQVDFMMQMYNKKSEKSHDF